MEDFEDKLVFGINRILSIHRRSERSGKLKQKDGQNTIYDFNAHARLFFLFQTLTIKGPV